MKYVTADGAVWKLTDRKFEELKKDIREGTFEDINKYGPMIVERMYSLDEINEEELEND